VGVVVVERSREELHVERAGGLARALGRHEAEAREESGGLLDADLVVVERHVEVDVLAAVDEAVVRDDRDALGGRGVELAAQRGAVDGGDDEEVDALRDHLVDLLLLRGDVVTSELDVDVVAGLGETGLDRLAVGDPALGRLRRHRDADRGVLGCDARVVRAAAGSAARAGRDGESQGESSCES
jgi:hypothetical protein